MSSPRRCRTNCRGPETSERPSMARRRPPSSSPETRPAAGEAEAAL